MKLGQLSSLIVAGDNPPSFEHAARTAVAAVVSYFAASLFRLPEPYWAAIATMMVMQSTLGATLPISIQRFVGSAIGAGAAAVTAAWFPGNLLAFGAAVFLTGLLCAILRIDRNAYRYAGITVAIVMLVPRTTSVWVIAIHRFFEVSLGIAMGLVISGVWPERQPENSSTDSKRSVMKKFFAQFTMRFTARFAIGALTVSLAAPAFPQALPNLASARLGYTVQKRTANPQGELKDKIDQNDRELAEATRLGHIGEVRRLIAKGRALLSGTAWTPELDFANSLALRTEHVFTDSARPYAVRLEQIYTSTLAVEHNLTAHASLVKSRSGAGGRGGRGGAAEPPEVVKDFGTFDDVSRDLNESPYLMELDLASIADGSYQLRVEVMDGAKPGTAPLGAATLRIVTVKGLEDALARIDTEAKSAPESIRADALYPADFVRNVNRGRVDPGAFDIQKEIANVGQMLAIAKSGKDPFEGRTGDFKRHYFLKAAGEIMPYRLYIPPAYDGSRAYPMVLALHGLGGTEDSMFGQNYRVIDEATKRGYIVAAPLGYRVDGGYGRGGTRRAELSEADTMEVLDRVRHSYKIDDNRIYLMGHSLGAFGTWFLGPKYPAIWAAMGPISGGGVPASLEKIRDIPEIVVHGDADTVVVVGSSRMMVEAAKKFGIEMKYIEVPGGTHGDVAGPNMAAIFDFFDAHKKGRATTGGGQ